MKVLLNATAKYMLECENTDNVDANTVEEAPLLFLQSHVKNVCADVDDDMVKYLWDLANTAFHSTVYQRTVTLRVA